MFGKRYNPDTYQYHQIAIGLEGERPIDYTHGLVTTLKTAMVHPVIQTLPFDLGTALSVFRNIHGALGLVNINFPDQRRDENYLALEVDRERGETRLLIHYQPEAQEPARMARTLTAFRKVLSKLGCIAPQSMTRPRPMGSSVHYSGTIPMSTEYRHLTCSKECRSYDFPNLFLVDGTTFPDLPAKNLTFTLMANAARVADQAF
jgi:choline dehydrogenase-like flavoprotein